MTNLDRFRQSLKEDSVTMFVVSDLASVRWLTGFTGSFAMAIVSADDAVFISDSRYTLQAAEQVSSMRVETFKNPQTADGFLKQQLESLGAGQVGFDRDAVTIGGLEKWQKLMPEIEWTAATDPSRELRMVKTAAEIQAIKAACVLADECMRHVVDQIRPGVTEIELELELERFLKLRGSAASFPPIVVSGPNTARPHGKASDRALQRGDLVTIDLGAWVDGYASDITRTVVVGPADDRQREVYAAVLEAQQHGVAALKPGASGRQIDREVRDLLERHRLAEYFGHGLGHGLGALVHDAGRLSPSADPQIAAGQVWTIEPGVYIEGFGGIRIEDDVLVTDQGPEVLTFFPTELVEVAIG